MYRIGKPRRTLTARERYAMHVAVRWWDGRTPSGHKDVRNEVAYQLARYDEWKLIHG
jgi:hypothetical protein